MSYLEDVRGALAYTSGASRRVMALRELNLPAAAQQEVQEALDDATAALLKALAVLQKHGHTATGSSLVAASAGGDKSWRERVYGGAKDSPAFQTVRERVKGSKPRTYDELFPPAQPAPEGDVAHPWRTGERQ